MFDDIIVHIIIILFFLFLWIFDNQKEGKFKISLAIQQLGDRIFKKLKITFDKQDESKKISTKFTKTIVDALIIAIVLGMIFNLIYIVCDKLNIGFLSPLSNKEGFPLVVSIITCTVSVIIAYIQYKIQQGTDEHNKIIEEEQKEAHEKEIEEQYEQYLQDLSADILKIFSEISLECYAYNFLIHNCVNKYGCKFGIYNLSNRVFWELKLINANLLSYINFELIEGHCYIDSSNFEVNKLFIESNSIILEFVDNCINHDNIFKKCLENFKIVNTHSSNYKPIKLELRLKCIDKRYIKNKTEKKQIGSDTDFVDFDFLIKLEFAPDKYNYYGVCEFSIINKCVIKLEPQEN